MAIILPAPPQSVIDDFRDDPGKPPLYENPPIYAREFSWRLGQAERLVFSVPERGDVSAFVRKKGGRSMHELPNEFFVHELLDLLGQVAKLPSNAEKDSIVLGFVSTWGLPFSPTRGGKLQFVGTYKKLIDDAERGVEETDALRRCLSGDTKSSFIDRDRFSGEGYDPDGVVSISECRAALSLLQHLTLDLFAVVRGEKTVLGEVPFELIELGSRNEFRIEPAFVPLYGGQMRDYQLTSAICNQMLAVMFDGMPWHECKRCKRLFKTRRPNDGHTPTERHKITTYCSKGCTDSLSKWRERHPGEEF